MKERFFKERIHFQLVHLVEPVTKIGGRKSTQFKSIKSDTVDCSFELQRYMHKGNELMKTKLSIKLVVAIFGIVVLTDCKALECSTDSLFIGQLKRELSSHAFSNIEKLSPRIRRITLGEEIKSQVSDEIDVNFDGFIIESNVRAEGYFFVLPGNAQTAESVVSKLLPISNAGYDVLIFDYRGLLTGSKIPTMKQLINDSKGLIRYFNAQPKYQQKRHVLYGISTGGVFALQAITQLVHGDVVILDSVPDTLPWYLFCDSDIYPENSIKILNPSLVTLLVMHGQKDQKVVPFNSRELISFAETNGGCYNMVSNGTHPFEDDDDVSSRIQQIVSFLSYPVCKR